MEMSDTVVPGEELHRQHCAVTISRVKPEASVFSLKSWSPLHLYHSSFLVPHNHMAFVLSYKHPVFYSFQKFSQTTEVEKDKNDPYLRFREATFWSRIALKGICIG